MNQDRDKAVFTGDTLLVGIEWEIPFQFFMYNKSVLYKETDDLLHDNNIDNVIITLMCVGGCGKFIDGKAQDVYHVLYNILGRLPKDTRIYCGHEYTLDNLEVIY